MAKVYISGSVQEKNIGYGDYGSEEYRMHIVSDFAIKYLRQQGLEVGGNDPSWTLKQICDDSNSWGADIHIAIHSDASQESAMGTTAFYANGYENSKRLAQCLYDEVAPLSPGNDRSVKADTTLYDTGLGELRGTKATAALIEVGFHSNPTEAEWIIDDAQAIGKAIAKGACKYLGIDFVDPDVTPAPSNDEVNKLNEQIASLQADMQKLQDENTYLKTENQRLQGIIDKDTDAFKYMVVRGQ